MALPPPHNEARRNFVHGWSTEDRPPPPPPPPPPRPVEGGGEATTAFRLSEALRNLELPSLPPPGGEGSSLQFGDWVTVITPLMSDIAGSARLWWEQVLQKAELGMAYGDAAGEAPRWGTSNHTITELSNGGCRCFWRLCRTPSGGRSFRPG